MDLNLIGKTALVTGASRGLGFAAAMGLAKEGCNLAINSRSEENIQKASEKIHQETGVEVLPIAADVTKLDAPELLVSQTLEKFGSFDLLITNAGGPPPGPFESFEESVWQDAVELSFMSHVRLIRASLPTLRESDAASVLTVTSISVKQPIENLVLSNSIRAATVGLTKTLALELGQDGIRFNSIMPSWTETERVEQLMTDRAETHGTTVEEEMAKRMSEVPLGRMATPEEFANVAVFLLSPAASYVTGAMLSVDGGGYKGIF